MILSRCRSADVVPVRKELGRYKKPVASQANHAQQGYTRNDNFRPENSGRPGSTPGGRYQNLLQPHGLSAVPAIALGTLTTVAAVSAHYQIGSRGISALRSVAGSHGTPWALRQAACMAVNALTAQGTAVSIGLTTGFGAPFSTTDFIYRTDQSLGAIRPSHRYSTLTASRIDGWARVDHGIAVVLFSAK